MPVRQQRQVSTNDVTKATYPLLQALEGSCGRAGGFAWKATAPAGLLLWREGAGRRRSVWARQEAAAGPWSSL